MPAFESRRKYDTAAEASSSSIIAVLTKDDGLLNAVRSTSKAADVKCLHFKTAERFLAHDGSTDILAILWDVRSEPADSREAGILAGRAPLMIYGPSPSLPDGVTAAALPSSCCEDCVPHAFSAFVEAQSARRRMLAAQKVSAEGKSEADALRRRVEFYELQRTQLSEVVRKTALLGQLTKELNCLDADKIIELCVTKVPTLIDATLASVYLVNEEDGELTLKKSNHPQRLAERAPLEPALPRLMTMALEKRATLLIRDVDLFCRNLDIPLDRSFAGNYKTASCVVVPLVNDNKPLAVLNLADKANGAPFDEVRDLPLIDHISQFIGIALHNCRLYQKVWQLAKTDALTGFINHNAFYDELDREVARLRRTESDLALVILDVDNFKLFNDVHGHLAGDMVLVQVAQLIKGSIRTIDVPARYGGDEFAIILANTEIEKAVMVAERIRRAIATSQMTYGGQTFSVTVSAGVARCAPGQSAADFVSEADAALYRAKSMGRNAVAVGSAGEPGAADASTR